MRFALLALIILTFPMFVAWLQSQKGSRDTALFLLGAMVFITGSLKIDAALITWPLWNGTARGVVISPADMLALALIVTRRTSGIRLPFKSIVAFYGLTVALSLVFSRLPIATAFSLWDFMRGALAFAAVGGEMLRPGAYLALTRGLAAGLILQAGYVAQQKVSGSVQATGTLAHQNLLGVMAEITLMNVLVVLLEGNKSWLLRAGVLSAAIILAGGGSRGALAIAGGGAAILIVFSLARRQTGTKWGIAAASLALVAMSAPVAMLTLKDRFGNSSILTQEEQRAAMERAALAMAHNNPMGVGANLYTNVSNLEGYADRAGVAWNKANRSVPVHNAYLLSRAELGYQGELAFVLLMLVPCLSGIYFAFRNRNRPLEGQILGPAVALGAVMVHSQYEFLIMLYTAQFPLMLSLGAMAGLIVASKRSRPRSNPVPQPDPIVRVPTAPALPTLPTMRRMR